MSNKVEDAFAVSTEEDDSYDPDSSCGSLGAGTEEDAHTANSESEIKSKSSSDSSTHIGSEESRKIYALRFFLFLVLVFSVAGALAVFFYLRHIEQSNFETQFEEDATKVLASIGTTLDIVLGAMDALVVSLVSYAKQTNQTWPFVTIPDFEVRAGKVMALSNGYIINIYANVQNDQRKQWETYTSQNNAWVDEAIEIQDKDPLYTGPIVREYEVWDKIHDYDEFDKENAGEFGTDREGPYLPWWQCVPVIPIDPPYNWDMMSWYRPSVESVLETHRVSLSDTYLIAYPNETEKIKENEAEAEWIKSYIPPDEEPNEPVSDIYYPIIPDATNAMNLFHERGNNSTYDPSKHQLGGMLALSSYWRDKIKDILPEGSNGIVAVFENPCNPTFTYQINGPTVQYLGTGDFHDPAYNRFEAASALHDLRRFAIKTSSYSGVPIADDVCPYTIRIFPSDTMKDMFVTATPIFLSVSAGAIFLFFALIFIIYDKWVQRRQDIVTTDAAKSAAIVSSMFPKEIQKRMMEEQAGGASGTGFSAQSTRLKTFLNDGTNCQVGMMAKPIADLFPHTTVLMADISGFTAWSSTRDPSQVFVLLETIFKSFDGICERRRVFKVETVGDSYVAVTGLPEPQKKHALLMARFAVDCLHQFYELRKRLEVSLGPDTADLGMRFGINSGPVTAGVLRGDRSRFQLFGDTVNTAARMESTGIANKIQISNTTAILLQEGGKGHWLERRDDMVAAKGKGVVETYWLVYRPPRANSVVSEQSFAGLNSKLSSLRVPSTGHKTDKKKYSRLVNWVTDLLLTHVKKVVARHEAYGFKPDDPSRLVYKMAEDKTCMDEVVEIIKLPEFDAKAAACSKSHNEVVISSAVIEQLQSIVATIAGAYLDNYFHNFEHACHVTMSVDKFLQRIVALDVLDDTQDINSKTTMASAMHDYTHGITSDPLSVLGIVFSALIHDVDHRGVSNAQLAQEDEHLAKAYKKSIAEQNSMDIAWDILMRPEYSEFRSALFCTRSEMLRFRQVVVNIVLATDIFDKELNELRTARWNRAFSEEAKRDKNGRTEQVDCKATIVIEHIMQASDVSHTMQHWHVYRKWNERLFMELRAAFRAGRMGKDPTEFWYQGEIGFFDNYIIPLAKKLRDCKVFGVSSDEVLNYAKQNRNEWKDRGQEIVASMVEKAEAIERQSALCDVDLNSNDKQITEGDEDAEDDAEVSFEDLKCADASQLARLEMDC